MDNDIILKLSNIYFKYHQELILENISFNVYNKDFLVILGPNGSGKTTLLKIILGLLKPEKGVMEFNNNIIYNYANDIAYVPQVYNFDRYFPIKVIDLVLMGALNPKKYFHRYNKNDYQNANNSLELLKIDKFKDRYINELSGGQLQKVLIARSLITKPKLLIMDEPNNFIDKDSQSSLGDILKEWNKELSIIMVSHDISFLHGSVKHIACLNKTLYYHGDEELSYNAIEKTYGCPIELLTHGKVPHRVLKKHD